MYKILLFLVFTIKSSALIYQVNTNNDSIDSDTSDNICLTASMECSLRAAIMQSNASQGPDTILLPSGIYLLTLLGELEDNSLTGDLDITDSLEIIGESRNETLIDGNQNDRVFELLVQENQLVKISNLSIINGKLNSGGNLDLRGGGMKINSSSTVEFSNVKFENNQSKFAGAILNLGTILADDIIFKNNTANFNGGAILGIGDRMSINLSRCSFDNNSAALGAIMLLSDDGFPENVASFVSQCAFINNFGNQDLIVITTRAHFNISNSTLSGNTSNAGGVINNDGGSIITISNSSIVNNSAISFVDVHHNPNFVFIKNSILAKNQTSSIDCNFGGFFTSLGGNYFSNQEGCEFTGAVLHNTDIIGDDNIALSNLVSFSNHWERIHLPLKNSLLLDSGFDQECEMIDQLNHSRVQDSDFDGQPHCNIGASAIGDDIFINTF